jgi:hypothetical protein
MYIHTHQRINHNLSICLQIVISYEHNCYGKHGYLFQSCTWLNTRSLMATVGCLVSHIAPGAPTCSEPASAVLRSIDTIITIRTPVQVVNRSVMKRLSCVMTTCFQSQQRAVITPCRPTVSSGTVDSRSAGQEILLLL